MSVVARKRSAERLHLAEFPGLNQYPDGRYYYVNPYTGRSASLKTRDLVLAKKLWALANAKAVSDYGDQATQDLAAKLAGTNLPASKGGNIHLCDFIRDWRLNQLEKGLVTVKIERSRGQPVTGRTQSDYSAQAKQIEAHDDARFPVAAPDNLRKIRKLLANWSKTPTHYNHLKALLGRVYDHAVFVGLVDRNPMKDVDRLPVAKREVLIPDAAYVAITDQLKKHVFLRKVRDGEWRARACDLLYMLSQQPIDGFGLRLSQIHLDAGDHGEIHLARSKTSVAGIIEMNAEFRECVDWLLAWRREQLKVGNVVAMAPTDHLLIYPEYMGRRYRWQPVTHRAFSAWWLEARRAAGIEEDYWLMDMRKMGLTEEFLAQGENDKGLHDTQRMANYYRLIKPPKRSRNTLKPIRAGAHDC